MANVTAIILTKDESRNIVPCLESIRGFASRIVVIDSGSNDDTVALAKEHGAEVMAHEFEYYAKQFNWAIDNARIQTEWILRLDADERFTTALCEEAEWLMAEHRRDTVNGLTMEAELFFLGRQLRHGLVKKRKLMIFKKGLGRIEDKKRDAHTVLSHGSSVAVKQKFIHADFRDVTSFINKYNWYAIREMQDYLNYSREAATNSMITDKRIQRQRKRKLALYYHAPPFFRSWLWYVYNYYFRLGFLDGREGQIFHYFECYWYRYLVDAKIYEHDKMGIKLEELTAFSEGL